MSPDDSLSTENRPGAVCERVPRAKWLASMSIVLTIATSPIEGDIDFVFHNVPVLLLCMLISVGVAVLPLFLFVAINGRFALRCVAVRVSLLCFLMLLKGFLYVWALVDIITHMGNG